MKTFYISLHVQLVNQRNPDESIRTMLHKLIARGLAQTNLVCRYVRGNEIEMDGARGYKNFSSRDELIIFVYTFACSQLQLRLLRNVREYDDDDDDDNNCQPYEGR